MERTRGMIVIAAAMTAGSGLAALITGRPDGSSGFLTAAAIPIAAILATILLSRGRARPEASAAVTFFLIGYTACFCSGIIPTTTGDGPCGMISSGPMKALIDRRFSNGQTRALLYALLSGDRSLLDKETVGVFRASGASHILALSGLHLGIIYTITGKVLAIAGNSRAAYKIRAAVSVAGCGYYTLMTGASPSIVRAFLFIALNETARLHPERERRPLNIYSTALIIQLALTPDVIRSTGFQLSYLAMLGIYLIFPKIQGWYPSESRFDPVKKIWDSMALSLSCQIFTAPLVLYKFGTFPIHFLLTNLLALPLTEALIVCSLLGAENATDFLSSILVKTLHIIASM